MAQRYWRNNTGTVLVVQYCTTESMLCRASGQITICSQGICCPLNASGDIFRRTVKDICVYLSEQNVSRSHAHVDQYVLDFRDTLHAADFPSVSSLVRRIERTISPVTSVFVRRAREHVACINDSQSCTVVDILVYLWTCSRPVSSVDIRVCVISIFYN